MKKPVAGQEVYVVEQTQRYSGEERRYVASVVRVGTKNAYIMRHGREAAYDWRTGRSRDDSHNARANGFGFDVYESQAEWAERQRQAARLRDLKIRLVGVLAYVSLDLSPSCVERLHAVLDEFGVGMEQDGGASQ